MKLLIVFIFSIVSFVACDNGLDLSIVHFNDFHARFDVQNNLSGVCKPGDDCHGGFARLYQAVMDKMESEKNPILLNAGDNFQGTLWYNLFKWNVTQYFMNLLPIKAHTLGNHEFDDEVAGLVPFLEAMNAPAVICNLDDSKVPEIQGKYRKSITFDVEGKKVAIVGVALSTTNEISQTGDLGFLDEVTSVNAEVDRLVREENIFTAIVLSHAGYYNDMKIAKEATKKISLIVGGHSHTFLNNATGEDGTIPEGTYPTVIKRDLDGQVVPVVQASAYTRYLGHLRISLDQNGEALAWDGEPIYLGSKLPQNETMLELLKPWQEAVEATGNRVFGSTQVFLEASTCWSLECNLGNLITDIMVEHYKSKAVGNAWTYASIAIMNSGGIRASIPVGNITYNDLITTQPFGNTFDIGIIRGEFIKAFLERTATPYRFRDVDMDVHLLQLSGFKVVYDLSKPVGSRVVDVKILCDDCPIPEYYPLDVDKDYKLIVASFIANGGDGFFLISENLRNRTVGPLDMDVFQEILPKISPVKTEVEGRITFLGRRRKTRSLPRY